MDVEHRDVQSRSQTGHILASPEREHRRRIAQLGLDRQRSVVHHAGCSPAAAHIEALPVERLSVATPRHRPDRPDRDQPDQQCGIRQSQSRRTSTRAMASGRQRSRSYPFGNRDHPALRIAGGNTSPPRSLTIDDHVASVLASSEDAPASASSAPLTPCRKRRGADAPHGAADASHR
ncbi:MAG: hypothetical protein U5K74_01470 [Gemmatimonadaceae bacterium]|nr:hypothetical protein [Gemmatimonadaceae bacterium]